jgi:hypothetical protein
MASPTYSALKAREWQRPLLKVVSGLLVFETVSGLAIYLLPFSVPNQMAVLAHTLAGIAFVLPYLWYQLRHWRAYRAIRLSHVVLTGYFSMLASLVLVVSGVVLTVQALFGTHIGRAWDRVHVVATFALVGSVVPHVATLLLRVWRGGAPTDRGTLRRASRGFALASICIAFALGVVVAASAGAYRSPALVNELPGDYSYVFGKNRPFAPNMATTETGGAYDARSLAGSASCGKSGCHTEIYREWQTSAHRYAAMDPSFQKVQNTMAEQNGSESTRYCAGCHDPISLFSGTKNIFVKDLTSQQGYQEGVSCVSCHAIRKTDEKGNAAFVISQPERYVFEMDSGPVAGKISDYLIRAYPQKHIKSLEHKLYKSPQFCGACHKQFIDQEINRVGFVQLQNQYDNWRKSRWNHPGDPKKTIECRECHMPLAESDDPSAGDETDYNRTPNDGRHRGHRFLGANQFIPLALKLVGAKEHVALTEQWLRGEIEVPEIADKWRKGPAVPIELTAPDSVAPGTPVVLRAQLTNNKPGHDFPTGPLDIIQAWVEITVTDQTGRVVFASGQRDSSHFIQPGSFMFKAEPVDQYGNLIDRHNLWEMVGVRYRRALYPGAADQQEFTFACPGAVVPATTADMRRATGHDSTSVLDRADTLRAPRGGRVTELRVTARLMYRKIDQFLLNFLFGKESGLTSPVTVMSEDSKTIHVTDRGGM